MKMVLKSSFLLCSLYVSEEKEEKVMENIVEKGKDMKKMRKESGKIREVKILAKKR